MAIAPDGSPSFRGKVPDVALASTAPSAAARRRRAAALDAVRRASRSTCSPGKIQLRISVEGAASQVLDSEMREITVPDLTSAQATLGTPSVLRARTAREFQQLKSRRRRRAASPAASSAGSSTCWSACRAYGPGGTTPVLRVHLLNRAGSAMNELKAEPSPKAGEQQIDLPLRRAAARRVCARDQGRRSGRRRDGTGRLPRHQADRHARSRRGRSCVARDARSISSAPKSAVPIRFLARSPRHRSTCTVTDARGRALTDLKPSDFELREGATPLPLESVRLVRVGSRPCRPIRRRGFSPPPTSVSPPGRNSPGCSRSSSTSITSRAAPSTDRVRDALTRFVDRDVSSRAI